jgi:hypothetical protein
MKPLDPADFALEFEPLRPVPASNPVPPLPEGSTCYFHGPPRASVHRTSDGHAVCRSCVMHGVLIWAPSR